MDDTQEIIKGIESLGEIYKGKIEEMRGMYKELKEQMDRNEEATRWEKAKRGTAGTGAAASEGIKSVIADAITSNMEGLKGLYTGETKHLHIQTKAVADMTIGAHLTGGTTSINSPTMGPVNMAYRWVNVRDMLRPGTMTGMYLPLLKDNGGEGTPAPVAEGATKPDIDFDLAEANAKAEVIAGTTTISKQFLEDVQNARTWLIDRLTELYNAAESDQLLNGNGTTPNLKGLNTSGNFTAASGAATIAVEKLVQAILQMRILKRRPTAIVVNPANLEELLLNKADTSGEYDLPSFVTVSPVGQIMIMGVPVIDVAEQPADTFTLHDNTGSQYTVRQGLTIEFFDQTYAKTNKILIRIESRIAFPTFGASYTVKGSF